MMKAGNSTREIWVRIKLVLISVMLTLSIIELILAYPLYYLSRDTEYSFYSRPHSIAFFKQDPEIGFVSTPNIKAKGFPDKHPLPNAPRFINYNSIETGSHGFRYKGDLKHPKPIGEIRVFSLGGSTTFGYNSTNEETYPQQLENLIADPGVRVINAGVGSYRSIHLLKLYKHNLRFFEPDILTIYSGWNDFEDSMYSYWRPGDPHGHSNLSQMNIANLPFSELALVWMSGKVYYGLKNYNRVEYASSNPDRIQRYIETAKESRWQTEYESNIQKLIELSKADGVLPVMVIFPSPEFKGAPAQVVKFAETDLHMTGRWEAFVIFLENIRKIQRRLAEKNDIPLIDVNESFEKMNGDYKSKFKLFVDRMHLAPGGNRLIAETMLAPMKKIIAARLSPN